MAGQGIHQVYCFNSAETRFLISILNGFGQLIFASHLLTIKRLYKHVRIRSYKIRFLRKPICDIVFCIMSFLTFVC